MIQLHTLTHAEYQALRLDFISAFEGTKQAAYLDTAVDSQNPYGIATIGIGFNLKDTKARNDVLDELGFDFSQPTDRALEFKYREEIEGIVTKLISLSGQAITNETQLQDALNEVMQNRHNDSNYMVITDRKEKFEFDSDQEMEAVFLRVVARKEEKVDNWIDTGSQGTSSSTPPVVEMANSSERLALLSLSYKGVLNESQSLYEAIVFDNDRAEAWYQIRHNTHKYGWFDIDNIPNEHKDQNGVAKRNYYESEMFGLYDPDVDGDSITLPEHFEKAKRVYEMFTQHRATGHDILRYENRFGVTPDGTDGISNMIAQANAAGGYDLLATEYEIETLEAALQPAMDALLLHYAQAFENPPEIAFVDMQMASEEMTDLSGTLRLNGVLGTGAHQNDLLVGNEQGNTLEGLDGDDILWGETGQDKLLGGKGNDFYGFNAGDGQDIISDSDGSGQIWVDGHELKGTSQKAHLVHGNRVWIDAQNFRYEFNPLGHLVITGGTLQATDRITIENFHFTHQNLGIALDETLDLLLIPGGEANPFYQTDPTIEVASSELNENGSQSLKVALNQPAQEGDKILISASGGDATLLSLTTGAQTLELGGEPVELILNRGQTEVMFMLANTGDLDATTPYTLSAGWQKAGEDVVSVNADFNLTVKGIHEAAPHTAEVLTFTGDDDDNDFDFSRDGVLTGKVWADAFGGQGRDYLGGGASDDILQGGAGADLLYGLEGDDKIYGDSQGFMADFISQGNTDEGTGLIGELVDAVDGDDQIFTGAGIDLIAAGDGDDLVVSGAGDDWIWGDGNIWVPIGNDWRQWSIQEVIKTSPAGVTIYTYALEQLAFEAAPGNGDDVIYAGAGNDWVKGEGGNDTLYLQAGDDKAWGGAGNDSLLGGIGQDILVGDDTHLAAHQQGADFLDGGDGNDELYGFAGSDSLFGGAGDDKIYGDSTDENAGDDYIDGESGEDILIGGGGSDQIFGGAGHDELHGDAINVDPALQGNDFLDGEGGNDILAGYGGEDMLWGGIGDDTLYGDDSETANAFQGDDFLDGGAGSDILYGAGGSDTLLGGDGNDFILADDMDVQTAIHGDDIVKAGPGDDTVWGYGGNDQIEGNDGHDILVGDGGDLALAQHGHDTIDGGDGDDEIYGMGGHDQLSGGRGMDILYGMEGDDTLDGGMGDDILVGDMGEDKLSGSDGDDFLYGDAGNDRLEGGEGDDTLEGGEGHDRLNGGDGHDTLIGGAGNDILTGGAGNDYLSAGPGEDTLAGGAGQDRYGFSLGDGVIRIQDTGSNTLVFGNGIFLNHLRLGLGSLMITIDGTDDEIHLENFDPHNPLDTVTIDRFEFADGTVIDYSQLLALGIHSADSTDGDDYLQGTPNPDRMDGKGGNDTLIALAGDDTVFGGSGDDTLEGNAGQDNLDGGSGIDDIHGGEGDDTLKGGDDKDYLAGGAGNDILYGQAGADELHGGSGVDQLIGGTGDDILAGGLGLDSMSGNRGDDTYYVDGYAENILVPVDNPEDIHADCDYGTAQEASDTTAGTTVTGNLIDNDSGQGLWLELIGFRGEYYHLHQGEIRMDLDYGHLTVQANGDYSYTPDDNHPRVQALNEGESLNEHYVSYKIIDALGESDTADLYLSISGATDAGHGSGHGEPLDTIDADCDYGTATAASDTTAGAIVTGNLIQNDSGNGLWVELIGFRGHYYHLQQGAMTIDVDYGHLTVQENGDYVYRIDNDHPNIEALKEGETLNEHYVSYKIIDAQGASDTADLYLAIHGTSEGSVTPLAAPLSTPAVWSDNTPPEDQEYEWVTIYHTDSVIEKADEGHDVVYASITYELADNVEDLHLVGHENLAGTGNRWDNILSGNGASNHLTGAGGNDELRGGEGDDNYYYGLGDGLDRIIDSAGFDSIILDDAITFEQLQLQLETFNGKSLAQLRFLDENGNVLADQGIDMVIVDPSLEIPVEAIVLNGVPYDMNDSFLLLS